MVFKLLKQLGEIKWVILIKKEIKKYLKLL